MRKYEMKRMRKTDRNIKVFISLALAFVIFLWCIPIAYSRAENKYQCALDEHEHTEACFELILQCIAEETDGNDSDWPSQETAVQEEPQPMSASTEDTAPNDADLKELQEEVERRSEEHIHDESCYKQELTCEKDAHVHEERCKNEQNGEADPLYTRELSYEDEQILVTVSFDESAEIPEDTVLSVKPVESEEDSERYNQYETAIQEQMLEETQTISETRFYDICFLREERELEPQSSVQVTITYKSQPIFTPEQTEMASSLMVLHMAEESGDLLVEDKTETASIDDVEKGISQIAFSAEQFSVYALVLLNQLVSDTYYQRVTEITDTNANYLIVSANGAHALAVNSTNPMYSKPVSMLPVKGNPKYYTMQGELTNDMLFRINDTVTSSKAVQIRSLSGTYVVMMQANMISNQAGTSTIMKTTVGTWRIGTSDTATAYYLSDWGDGFAKGRNAFGTTSQNAIGTVYQNMIIYQQVKTALTIPADVSAGSGSVNTEHPTKPSYPAYITPSQGIENIDEISGREVTYRSDNATSNIETLFSGAAVDNGKVWTDKSVIYMKDDYGAFSDYDKGSFGVTLSALTQEHKLQTGESYSTPMDVVFVLDISGSMDMTVNGETRLRIMANALNRSIHQVMNMNSENRVGVVYFNQTSGDFLNLDSYYVGSASSVPNYSTATPYEYIQVSGMTISTNANLRYCDSRNQVAQSAVTASGGTYTQQGIQRGGEMFFNQTETTYTYSNGVTVHRTPLMILLSDGMATYGSPNYMDPLNGPHYGNGDFELATFFYQDNAGKGKRVGDLNNPKGIMGYYTVLTANYYKRMIGTHYGTVSKFSTIGLGIYDKDEANSPYAEAARPAVGIGDDFVRAVLAPSQANLVTTKNNTSAPREGSHGPQLYDLLNNSVAERNITVRFSGDKLQGNMDDLSVSKLGITNVVMPVLPNPYEDFNYADSSYFGANLDTEKLSRILIEILRSSEETTAVYLNSLEEHTPVTFSDAIGIGMEVKDRIVLRYAGTNYACEKYHTAVNGDGSTSTYYRTVENTSVRNARGELVPLRGMSITVTTGTDKKQIVKWSFDEQLLPAYRQSEKYDYFYEMLPIRLIYQVGPRTDIAADKTQTGPYYAGDWQYGSATAIFVPGRDNLYYKDPAHATAEIEKIGNLSETLRYSCKVSGSGETVAISLGNNGSLRFAEEEIKTTQLEVKKIWLEEDRTPITDVSGFADVIVQLYQIQGGTKTAYLDPVTLGNSNNWQHEWTELHADEGIDYLVEEISTGDYTVTYVRDTSTQKNKINIINTLAEPKTTNLEVEKYWFDADNNYMADTSGLADVTIQLYRVQGGIKTAYLDPVKLGNSNNWRHEWTGLRVEAGIEYQVEEISTGDYTVEYQKWNDPQRNKIYIFNTMKRIENINITVEKKWLDIQANETNAKEMPAVTVYLFRRLKENPLYLSPAPVEKNPVLLSDDNNWTYSFKDLPPQDAQGRPFSYLVVEAPVAGFDTYYERNDSGELIVSPDDNRIETDTKVTIYNQATELLPMTEIMVEKRWQDYHGGVLPQEYMPESVDVTLKYRRGYSENRIDPVRDFDQLVFDEADRIHSTITLTADDAWKHTWPDLRASVNAKSSGGYYYYFYYVEEVPKEGFFPLYSENNHIVQTETEAGIRDGTVIITNKAEMPETLPEAGGIGTDIHKAVGLVLMAAMPIRYICRIYRKKKGRYRLRTKNQTRDLG